MLKQSGETLAGRITYPDLRPLRVGYPVTALRDTLWLLGRLSPSLKAICDAPRLRWRESCIRTYLARETFDAFLQLPVELR